LEDYLRHLSGLRDLSWRNALHVIDILLVAYLIYRVLLLVRGSRAWRIVWGIVIFIVLLLMSRALQLTALSAILQSATVLGPVALVILLLPELRQALEGIGKVGTITRRLGSDAPNLEAHTVEEMVAAVTEMAASNVGALIVVEKGAPLEDIVANGVRLDAEVSSPLLGSIFYEGNPLHDGAAVVRANKIVAAACRLPLSESMRLDKTLHMRHRAAVGVTEQLDCLAIVVSEERGVIRVSSEGRLRTIGSPGELREVLNRELRGVTEEEKPANGLKKRLRRMREAAK
jgi:diadenylate cyclase